MVDYCKEEKLEKIKKINKRKIVIISIIEINIIIYIT